MSDGKHQLLLTGDIGQRSESQLVSNWGDKLASSILVSPHHGSRTSSSPRFIDSVNPEYVVHSASINNPWGFPDPKVRKRYGGVNSGARRKVARSALLSIRIKLNHLLTVID
ncbi:ComEC/Rec2 family competence protein [Dongshaea marina]|uniref:ComEC/Rec2 family competence protein n=1 Tax=Dongshaea marina TaxID=2047966 RepID=UPI000D3EDE80|nr:hypothetical protein [Dongshaea marina]